MNPIFVDWVGHVLLAEPLEQFFDGRVKFQFVETTRREFQARHSPFLTELRRRVAAKRALPPGMRVNAIRFLFDEDCNGRIVRGLRRRTPTLNTATVLEAGLGQATDEAVLEHASTESRVVISHDYSTMRACAEDRLRAGLPMAGLILVSQHVQLGKAIEESVLIAETTSPEEWRGQIVFLPL